MLRRACLRTNDRATLRASSRKLISPLNRPELAGSILTIDLGALRENYRRLTARLDGAACAAVVKADGYGLGAAVVASALREEGCASFFVAHPAEGISLRRALGPEPEIFVLNGVYPGAEDDCAEAGLVTVVNSARSEERRVG